MGDSAPAARRFYYGWVNVVLASVAMSATFPGRTYGLGLIKEKLRADLLLDDLQFNWINFWAIILGAVAVPPTGWLIDRLGTRPVLTLVAVLLGGSVLTMSRAWDETSLFVALTCVRGLGQGALSVVAIALVAKWFKRRAGLAMAVFSLLLAPGFIIPPVTLTPLIGQLGWRPVWEGVGYVLLLGLAPLGLLVARSTPESVGVTPDEPALEEANARPSFTLGEALRTPAFWVVTFAATLFNLVFSTLTLDNEQLLREHGLEAEKMNGAILGILMFSGLPASFLAGWLARRYEPAKLLAVGVAVLAASLLVFPFVRDFGTAAAYGATLGISGGFITVVYFAIYGQYYGRLHLGKIQSAVQVLSVFSSATGPLVLAAVRKYAGQTEPYFYGFAIASVAAALACWLVWRPERLPV